MPDANNGDYPTAFPQVAAVLLADNIFNNLVNAIVAGVTMNVMTHVVKHLEECGIRPSEVETPVGSK